MGSNKELQKVDIFSKILHLFAPFVACPIYTMLWLGGCLRKVRARETGASEWGKLAVCRSKSRCGGIFEKLHATADPGALTRSLQKTKQVQKKPQNG